MARFDLSIRRQTLVATAIGPTTAMRLFVGVVLLLVLDSSQLALAQSIDLPQKLPANESSQAAYEFTDQDENDETFYDEDLDTLAEPIYDEEEFDSWSEEPCANCRCHHHRSWCYDTYCGCGGPWSWQLLPNGIIYRAYLAGVKESRLASTWLHEPDFGDQWESTLGGRVGILRYGTSNAFYPEGWQIDVEGSAQVRLDPENNRDVDATDYRVGVPLTWREGPWEAKFGYYHLSSHVGDEFLLRNPDFTRINYTRDALVLGAAYRPTPEIRLYGEAAYGFFVDVAEPWEFQFGVDIAPFNPTGIGGAPFAAVNGYLREEVDFGGNVVFQTGWAWRGSGSGRLLRAGFEYFNGKSRQFSFFDEHEEQIGGGIWFDY